MHERSIDSDFLLLELRELLKHNDEVKIILMSATINHRVFVEYFNGAPVLEIPGFTYPIEDIYLEDVLPKLNYSPPSAKNVPRQTDEELRALREEFEATGLDAQSIRAIENFTRSDKLDYQVRQRVWLRQQSLIIHSKLISKVVSHIVETAEDPEGAILIFLTGVQEKRQCTDILGTSVLAPKRLGYSTTIRGESELKDVQMHLAAVGVQLPPINPYSLRCTVFFGLPKT